MAHGIKVRNQYADAVGDLYKRTPKAVWAALAVSYACMRGDGDTEVYPEDTPRFLIEEWRTLYEQGLVPQAPPAS